MWRSMFLALGAYCCLLGMECLAVDKAILKEDVVGNDVPSVRREVAPPDWAPWSLLATGSVVVLYSFTIPQRVKVGE